MVMSINFLNCYDQRFTLRATIGWTSDAGGVVKRRTSNPWSVYKRTNFIVCLFREANQASIITNGALGFDPSDEDTIGPYVLSLLICSVVSTVRGIVEINSSRVLNRIECRSLVLSYSFIFPYWYAKENSRTFGCKDYWPTVLFNLKKQPATQKRMTKFVCIMTTYKGARPHMR